MATFAAKLFAIVHTTTNVLFPDVAVNSGRRIIYVITTYYVMPTEDAHPRWVAKPCKGHPTYHPAVCPESLPE